MVEIPWTRLAQQPKTAEALIGMLIVRLRPQAVPVDGSGGDGGRDLFEYTDVGELVNYEIKSFTGRMVDGRRQQVIDSLKSTARHQPNHWDLLVPIDPTPGEQRWFDSLRDDFPFVRDWRGLTWLNAQFADHPELVRYAVYNEGEEILKLIGEARAERDVMLRAVPDLVDRYTALLARASELSTHYELVVRSDIDGEPVVQISPRGQQIPEGEQISVEGQIGFPAQDPVQEALRQKFEDTIRFGGEDIHLAAENLRNVAITAPASLGIAGPADQGTLTLLSNLEPLPEPITATLLVRTESGLPAASLHLTFDRRSTGTAGGRLYGADATGALTMHFQLEIVTRRSRLDMSFAPPERGLPNAYLPVLRLASQMLPGRTLEFELHDHGGGIIEPIPTDGHLIPPEAARWWSETFTDLAHLQNLTAHFFPVAPADLTPHEAREIKETLALLNGEHVRVEGNSISLKLTSLEALDRLTDGVKLRLAAVHPNVVHEISGTEISLGPMVQIAVVGPAINLLEARQQLHATGQATVTFPLSEDEPPVRYLGSTLPGQALSGI
ncbi:hypothetical protein OHV05_14485 [Kitasatospora sp. NBC_00070]|uniref:hypothetical protein n=1 Tax=Kitasatospora sp. NBC_00070 TaxID=2975962 RepID=UPI003243CE4B